MTSSHGGHYSETIAKQLRNPIPRLQQIGGTVYPSRYGHRLVADNIDTWEGFDEGAIDYIDKLADPTRNGHGLTIEDNEAEGGKQVPRVDAAQLYLLGQEDSLKGKHTQLVAESLNRMLAQAGELGLRDIPEQMSMLRFADPKCIQVEGFRNDEPDMVVVHHQEGGQLSLRAVLKMKTWWTGCELGALNANPNKTDLGRWLGQLAWYMNQGNCKYGAFSNHRETIFVKRSGQTQFSVSPTYVAYPADTNHRPALREAYLYWLSIIATDHHFDEKLARPDMLIAVGHGSSDPTTPQSSPGRRPVGKPSPLGGNRPGSSGRGGGATGGVNEQALLKRLAKMELGEDIVGINGHESPPISNGVDASQLDADLETCKLVDIDGTCIGWFTKDVKIKKRVFKGTFIRASNGEKITSIMKVFPPEDDPSFDDGRTTLFDTELWASTRMNGSQYTPPLITSGRSRGGYTTPGGDVVIKGICPGIRVQDDVWDSLTPATEGHPILDALKAAIQAFRDQNLVLWDLTREDVLWDESTQKLTIVDLESADSLTRVPGATDRFEIRELIPAFWK